MPPWLIIGIVAIATLGLVVLFASLGVASNAERNAEETERSIDANS